MTISLASGVTIEVLMDPTMPVTPTVVVPFPQVEVVPMVGLEGPQGDIGPMGPSGPAGPATIPGFFSGNGPPSDIVLSAAMVGSTYLDWLTYELYVKE
jgi:hypothetical protein